MIGIERVVRRRTDVRYRVVPPETVVIRQAGPEVLVLNEVAGRILDLADGRSTLEDIARGLASDYEVSPDRARRDVQVFVEELMAAELIELLDAGDDG